MYMVGAKLNSVQFRNCPEQSRHSYFIRRFRVLGLPNGDVSCIIVRYLVGIGLVIVPE